MAETEQRGAYELWIEGHRERLRVASLRGREALSRPYVFDVAVATRKVLHADQRALVGARAVLAFGGAGGVVRRVRGVIAAAQLEGHPVDRGQRFARLRLVPSLWLLRHRRTSRIFQDQSLPDVVGAVLDEHGVAHRWCSDRRFPPLEYCVQYRESDYDFVARLLAEHGVFYFFEQPQDAAHDLAQELGTSGTTVDGMAHSVGGAPADDDASLLQERLVLCDDARWYPALPGPTGATDGDGAAAPTLRYAREFEPGGPERGGEVTAFALRHHTRSTAVEVRGYDYLRPLVPLQARAEAPPDAPVTAATAGAGLEWYEHDDLFHRGDIKGRTAKLELERFQARVRRGRGASGSRQLAPGHRFVLEDHPVDELNDEYAVTAVEHEARDLALHPAGDDPGAAREAPWTYRNRFACVPAAVSYRPRRPPATAQQTLETATVVGPASEEIYTDEHGRIKVQFHWDRAGRHDERSSCWVRVAQTWAGSGFGSQFVPRVGMEVLVSFVGADVDRPVVTGCLYNGARSPAYALPHHKTRSGIRTQSSPGGGGFNELCFEDARGQECVTLRAERDLDTRVGHSEQRTVGHSRSTTVEGAESLHVGGALAVAVRGAAQTHVAGHSVEHVGGRRAVTVAHDSSFETHGDARVHVERDVRGEVAGAARIVVGREGGRSPVELEVHGPLRARATKKIELSSDEGIVLRCGESTVEITADQVRIASTHVVVAGTDTATVRGDGPKLTLTDKAVLRADEVRLVSSGASVKMTGEVLVGGSGITLGAAQSDSASASDASSDADRPRLRIKVLDEQHAPIASRKYVLDTLGRRFEGTTDDAGVVNQEVPADTDLAELEVFLDDPPGPRSVRYTLRVGEAPDAAATLRGAQQRLASLGLYHGPPHGRLDDGTRDALQRFQRLHRLEVTGEHDDATRDKLSDLYA